MQRHVAWTLSFIERPTLESLDVVGRQVVNGDRTRPLLGLIQEPLKGVDGCYLILVSTLLALIPRFGYRLSK